MRLARPYKIIFVLLLISFAFVLGNLFLSSPFRKLKLTRYLNSPVDQIKYSLVDIEKLMAENKRLREIVGLYEIERLRLNEVLKENDRLRFRLNLKTPSPPWKLLWARLNEVYSQEVILDKGKAQGLETGSPVLAADILVGRISRLWQDKAMAILLTHPNFSVGVKLSRSGVEAVGEGLPLENALRLKYIPRKSDVKLGDEIITSGRGGIFPPGLKVGEIVEVSDEAYGFFLEIKVKPFLDLSQLEEVAVLLRR